MHSAWLAALLQRCEAKHFPEKPEDMWAKPKGESGETGIIAVAKALHRQQENEKRRGKRKRKRAVTIHRPIDE